ncbi:MAG TPA: hypothetical protein ACFE0H_05095 [Elainellaceae cyanobacterium]
MSSIRLGYDLQILTTRFALMPVSGRVLETSVWTIWYQTQFEYEPNSIQGQSNSIQDQSNSIQDQSNSIQDV